MNKEQQKIIKADFKIYDLEEHLTEFYFYVNGKNILEYIYDSKEKWTTTGDLDDLLEYLKYTLSFIEHDEPFPYDIKANSAVEMDDIARDFDTDDQEEFDRYYDKLEDWSWKHCWVHERAGAFVPDVMFRKVRDNIEISWMSAFEDENVQFTNPKGCVLVPCFEYFDTITDIISAYNQLWKDHGGVKITYKIVLSEGNKVSKKNIKAISKIMRCDLSEAKEVLESGNKTIFIGYSWFISEYAKYLDSLNIKYSILQTSYPFK